MKEKGLRERQRRFADFYLECGNASEAARRAGYKPDYGWRLLRDEGVKQFLAGRLEAMDDKRVADAGEVLKYLTSVLRGEAGEELKSPTVRMRAAELLGKRFGVFQEGEGEEKEEKVVIVDDVKGK
ncbi:MAG TPA: terminase small subunit [Candidatus Pullichristensenella excrementigallinarum]|uniref:Terminase small subunit n=1 Tax=Candidatus Pullichristensenella excrementigallinarum TaxID=2840907 RepID=A0A9D1ICE2_9FIRM|nr:terminase small subunit [Candidatus Pullichristensenella excrementigallinarum]